MVSRHAVPSASSIGLPLVLLLALLTALDAMAIDMYLPGMPIIASELGVSAGRVQQTLAVFLAGLAIGQAIYGPLLDRYGRRRPLLAGVVVFIAGSVLAGLAPSIEWLLAARFLQAIGAAAGLVAPRAIVADRCNLAQSSHIFSVLMQVMMIAPIVAPILGGFLLGLGNWRHIFWTLALIGLAGLVWGYRAIPDSLPAEHRVALNVRNIGLGYGRQARQAVFMAYTLAGGFAFGSLFAYISGSAFIFTEYFGLTPTQFSYLFAVNSVALMLGGYLSNRLLRRGVSERRILYAGIVLHGLAGLGLYVAVRMGVATLGLYTACLAVAIGVLGMIFGNITALTMANAGRQIGVASALMGTLHYLLSAVIGYAISLTAPGPGQLPAAIAVCGAMAGLLCLAAGRGGRPGQRDTGSAEHSRPAASSL